MDTTQHICYQTSDKIGHIKEFPSGTFLSGSQQHWMNSTATKINN
jgi:hypothetical protein